MKSSLVLLIMIAISGVACPEVNDGIATEKQSEGKPLQAVVSLHELLARQKKYKDHKVTIAAYFVTHVDGPWIGAERDDSWKRLETTLSLKNVDKTKFKLIGTSRSRIRAFVGPDADGKPYPDAVIDSLALHFGDFKGGMQCLITGTFRVGHYSYPSGFSLENHPFIELEEIKEVDAGDPRWKAAQPKGEQSGR